MKVWLKRIQAWCSRRQLRSLERWEQIRAGGKRRFVVRTALQYGFAVVGMTDLTVNLFYGGHYVSLGDLISYVLTGIPIALIGWSSMEARYKRALDEARIKALPSSKHTPHGEA